MCSECYVIITDSESLVNIKETVKKEKEKRKKKEPLTYSCNACTRVINSKIQRSVQCTQCKDWLHQTCAGFKTHGEVYANKLTFRCTICKGKQEEIMDRNKIILGYNGINPLAHIVRIRVSKNWLYTA